MLFLGSELVSVECFLECRNVRVWLNVCLQSVYIDLKTIIAQPDLLRPEFNSILVCFGLCICTSMLQSQTSCHHEVHESDTYMKT